MLKLTHTWIEDLCLNPKLTKTYFGEHTSLRFPDLLITRSLSIQCSSIKSKYTIHGVHGKFTEKEAVTYLRDTIRRLALIPVDSFDQPIYKVEGKSLAIKQVYHLNQGDTAWLKKHIFDFTDFYISPEIILSRPSGSGFSMTLFGQPLKFKFVNHDTSNGPVLNKILNRKTLLDQVKYLSNCVFNNILSVETCNAIETTKDLPMKAKEIVLPAKYGSVNKKTKKLLFTLNTPDLDRGFDYFSLRSFKNVDLKIISDLVEPGTVINIAEKTTQSEGLYVDAVFTKKGKVKVTESIYLEEKTYTLKKLLKAIKKQK